MRLGLATFFTVLVLLPSLAAMGQTQRGPFSVGLQAGVSYSGWNLALIGQYHLQDFSAYLGPSMSLNRGLPGKGPLGLSTGVNYHIASQKKWLGSIVNLDYQLQFFRAGGASATQIHELHLSYGVAFHIGEAITIVQQLGYGGYLESNPPTVVGDKRRNFTGYGGLVRLKAGYRF